MDRPSIIAVDGPAGSGKSSICNLVAERLGWTYVNTGALYRAVGLIADERSIDLTDGERVSRIVEEIAPQLRWDSKGSQLWLGERNLTNDLLSVKAGNAASAVAKLEQVRQNLLPVQRQLALKTPKGALVDGRDIGTVVFPDADLKVFLTASLEERASRRFLQLVESGKIQKTIDEGQRDRVLKELAESIAARDAQDSSRDKAPLVQAEDAVYVDTSEMNIKAVVEHIVSLYLDAESSKK